MTNPTETTRLLVTPEQAAEILSIGRTKVYELMATGTLRSVRIGRCRRIPTVAVNDLVNQLDTALDPDHTRRPHPDGQPVSNTTPGATP